MIRRYVAALRFDLPTDNLPETRLVRAAILQMENVREAAVERDGRTWRADIEFEHQRRMGDAAMAAVGILHAALARLHEEVSIISRLTIEERPRG